MYPGGKGSVFQKIINLIPPHHTYIESHVGGGSVLDAKRPATLNIGVDLSLRALEALHQRLPGVIVTNGEMDVHDHLAKKSEPAPEATPEIAIPARYLWVKQDAVDFLKAYPYTGHEFVYCDPPYPFETRTSKRPIYQFEYTHADHVRLLACLRTLPCLVMVSSYWSSLYADTLHAWHTYTYKATKRNGKQADEWLWMNYSQPTRLHDYQYLGDNFRQRERINRIKTRWGKRLKKMSILEQQAILSEMQAQGFID